MRAILSAAILIALFLGPAPAFAAANPEQIIKQAADALAAGRMTAFTPPIRARIAKEKLQEQLKQAGPIQSFSNITSVAVRNGNLVRGRTIHAAYVIDWTVGYSPKTQRIETFGFKRMPRAKTVRKSFGREFPRRGLKGVKTRSTIKTLKAGQGNKKSEAIIRSAKPASDSLSETADVRSNPKIAKDICEQNPALCQTEKKDVRSVEFLFATTRAEAPSAIGKVSFSGSRAMDLAFGAARVRIPEKHEIGQIELPKKFGLWGITIYETKLDQKNHFVIKSVVKLDQKDWGALIKAKNSKEALVFVHGYHTTFEEALYRNAQIVWDLQYKRGPSILFTWASKGQLLDYVYDQQSALIAREAFLKLLRILRDDYNIEKINVLAHSMGNLIVLDALANEERTQNPIRISELILAAPDVDSDYFRQTAPIVRKITSGMTLYCSANDKAMITSRQIAKVARAGDVPAGGPIVVPGVETIDVSALGDEFLGINHDVFASTRSVMNDIKGILNSGLRPPDSRGEARGVPEGAAHPNYWRYPN